jgi:hypothetical protein
MKRTLIFLFSLVAVLALVYWMRHHWRRKLSGDDGDLTIVHVYSSFEIKGKRYYEYIYKVGNDYYSDATAGSNVTHEGDSMNLQYFPVSYYRKDPRIHVVLWSYKIKDKVPLGLNLDSLSLDKSALVKKHTSLWSGLSPTADKNDIKALQNYTKTVQALR